jgi:porin
MKRIFCNLLPIFFFFIGNIVPASLIGQELSAKGIAFGTTGSLEGYYNFTGGIKKGSAFAALLDANVNLDLEKLIGWKGGSFYLDFEYHGGDNPTSTLVGDFQVFDKNNADPFFEALELWYQQILFNNKLRIKIGKVDANTEFSVIDNGLGFINSPTQVTPAFPVFPTFPDPMPGITMFFNPNHLLFIDFALYNANQSEHLLNFYGDPSSAQLSRHGQLFIVESGLNWNHLPLLGNDGNFKVGLWKHNGFFPDFSGNQDHGLDGIYVIFDQTLWKSTTKQKVQHSVRMFLEYALTDSRISPVFRHYGGGIVWSAPSGRRPNDALGFSVQDADLSAGLRVPEKFELNYEAYYQFAISNGINLKPDIQYIVHPGGIYHNALVSTFMLNFAFPSDNGN